MKAVLTLLCVWLAVLLPGRAAAAIVFIDGSHVVHKVVSRPGGTNMQDIDLNMDGTMDFYIGDLFATRAVLNPFLGSDHRVLATPEIPPDVGRWGKALTAGALIGQAPDGLIWWGWDQGFGNLETV